MYWLTKALSRNPRWPSDMRAKHMRGVWCCVLEGRGGAHHISRKYSSPSSWRPKERSKQSGSSTRQLLMRRAGARHHQHDRNTARGSNQRHQRHQRRFLPVGRARLSKRSAPITEFHRPNSSLYVLVQYPLHASPLVSDHLISHHNGRGLCEERPRGGETRWETTSIRSTPRGG